MDTTSDTSMNDTTSIDGLVITPSSHCANEIELHDRVSNPEQLMQKISLGGKLEMWALRKAEEADKREMEEMRWRLQKQEWRSPPTNNDEDSGRPQVEILQSSFSVHNASDDSHCNNATSLMSSDNGLVWSVINAYSSHHHLTLRPEDLWFAILTQFSAYVNAHAETFRHMFVAHDGQKELNVGQLANRYTADYSSLANKMSDVIQQNILDDELRAWIVPEFSTTTDDDKVVASVLMMATMQKYFSYTYKLSCGLPSVTLLGKREDYEQILKKLDRLERYGDEAMEFASLLKPVLSRFMSSFDNPSAPEILDFWQRVAHVDAGGSGPTVYSGWITAFCFWDKDGKRLKRASRPYHRGREERPRVLELDGVRYHAIESGNVPLGYSKVPVKINDNGVELAAEMTAGSVGIACSSSGQVMHHGRLGLDSMRPVVAWWIVLV